MIQNKLKVESQDVPINNLIDIVRGPNIKTYSEITSAINNMFGLELTVDQVYLSENPTLEELEEDYNLTLKHNGN